MMRKLHIPRTLCRLLLCLAAPTLAAAQDESANLVAGYENEYVAITGATIHTKPGEVIENGTVLLNGGLIQAVGTDVEVPAGARVIEADGLSVYAGFIDAGATHLVDEGSVPAPPAGREIDFERYALAENSPDQHHGLWPHVDVLEHLDLSEDQQQNYRREGVTVVHIVRAEPILGGQTGIVSLSGRPDRETRLRSRLFEFLQLAPPNSGGEIYPVTIMGAVAHFRQRALDALYCEVHCRLYDLRAVDVQRPADDEVLNAMLPMLHAEQQVLIGCDVRDGIHRALDCAEEHELNAIVLGGLESGRVADRLAAMQVPVLLEVDFSGKPDVELPQPDEDEAEPETDEHGEPAPPPLDTDFDTPVRVQQEELADWQRRVGNALTLHEAGVSFAFASNGMGQPENLLRQVRVLITEGLPVDVALDGLTRSAASLLGLGNRLGTVESGKLAHLVVLTGPMEDDRSVTRFTIVDGRVFEFNEDAQPVTDEEPAAEEEATEEPADMQPSSFAGTWDVTLSPGMDPMTSATIEFVEEGDNLTGSFTSDSGDGRIEEVSIEVATIRFTVRIGAGDDTLDVIWEGSLTDEEGTSVLTGTVRSPFGGTGQWRAVRTSQPEPEPENPVTIGLEPEDDATEETTDEATAAAIAADLPTELESDRLERGVVTGGNVLVRAGTVWTGAGETLEDVCIIIRNGRIAEIGPDLTPDAGMVEIDAGGWFVMPGMIDTHSHSMFAGGVNEYSQSIVCEVGVRDVVISNDVAEYRALSGGLTTARLLHGSANVIGGQDAVVKLRYGLTPFEHILWDAPQGVKFALGENVKHESGRFPATRMGVEATLQRAFFEALDYRRRWQEYRRESETLAEGAMPLLPPRTDLRLDILMDIINQDAFIHCHCYRADETLMLFRTADSLGVRIQSLQHVLEGYKIAPEILAHGASCSTFADWWAYKIEAYDATPYNTTLLNEAGVNIVVKSDNAELMRHMNLEAAKSLRYGNMPADDALSMVTMNAARELGLDDRIGSIEVGKDGDLAIFNGNPLSAFSRCELTIIGGEVYFNRAHQPTAMSEAGQRRSETPPAFELAPPEVRERTLELPESTTGAYAIVGATVHPVDGPAIEAGVVLVKDGLIEAVGHELDVPESYAVIDAAGMHVYPGLIDSGTTLGITEIEQVGKTHDYSETGQYQPDVRAGTAVNVDSELIPVARAGGVTLAFLRPTGGVIAGQCSLMQTAGWTSPEMIIREEAGLSLNWQRGGELEAGLREFLEECRRYDAARLAEAEGGEPVIRDPRYDEMRPYINGRRRVFVEAHSREEIASAINFAEEEELKIVITGGTDAWKLADELRERRIHVIVGPTMRDPMENWDPFDATYANAGRLHEAGVLFSFRSDDASNSRNVSFEAAIAVAYGLPERIALRAVTLNAARILGVADRYGSITAGKVANLVISDGSPLQQTTQIKGVFVAGVPYPPESRQTRFYERYRQRIEPAE